MTPAGTPLDGLAALVPAHGHLVCDVWGVLHDGGAAFGEAVEALHQSRKAGARVIALSNSPKRGEQVAQQLHEKGIAGQALDAVVTSGELTRWHLERDWRGKRFFHLGPARDRQTVTGLPLIETEDVASADVLVVTGPSGGNASADEQVLLGAAERDLPFLCANPDRYVRLASGREPCAGLLAERYAALGGRVEWMGKPGPAPYRACRARFAAWAGAPVADRDMLAIGDGLATDILGATRAGLSALFIEDGLHREEIAEDGVEAVLARYEAVPDYRMRRLAWSADAPR